jgi:hypothetical protein
MDSRRLDELLEKYWQCQTSLGEEQELRNYFTNNRVPDEALPAARLFRYFEIQKQQGLQNDFDQAIIAKVRQDSVVRTRKLRALVTYSLRIAAGIAVLVAAFILVRQELRAPDPVAINDELVDTFNDPLQAFEETKKALEMISRGFGRAEQQAKKINVFNEAQEKIQNQLKKQKKL